MAIRNFKAYFLSVLAGTAQDFPPSLWDRILPQTEIRINLLRQSNATPKVSAYAHLSGPFDYNKIPLAPMGISVQVHEKTDKICTWAYHKFDGWYLVTSPERYRTHRCHIKSTNNKRFTDTIHFNHRKLIRPTITHADKVISAIADCAKTIKDLGNRNRSEKMNQLIQITERTMQHKTLIAMTPTTTMCKPEISRVPLYTNNNRTRQTISMTQPNPQLPTLYTPSVPRVEQSTKAKRKHRAKKHKSFFSHNITS